jgi:hypothetical protein
MGCVISAGDRGRPSFPKAGEENRSTVVYHQTMLAMLKVPPRQEEFFKFIMKHLPRLSGLIAIQKLGASRDSETQSARHGRKRTAEDPRHAQRQD